MGMESFRLVLAQLGAGKSRETLCWLLGNAAHPLGVKTWQLGIYCYVLDDEDLDFFGQTVSQLRNFGRRAGRRYIYEA